MNVCTRGAVRYDAADQITGAGFRPISQGSGNRVLTIGGRVREIIGVREGGTDVGVRGGVAVMGRGVAVGKSILSFPLKPPGAIRWVTPVPVIFVMM